MHVHEIGNNPSSVCLSVSLSPRKLEFSHDLGSPPCHHKIRNDSTCIYGLPKNVLRIVRIFSQAEFSRLSHISGLGTSTSSPSSLPQYLADFTKGNTCTSSRLMGGDDERKAQIERERRAQSCPGQDGPRGLAGSCVAPTVRLILSCWVRSDLK